MKKAAINLGAKLLGGLVNAFESKSKKSNELIWVYQRSIEAQLALATKLASALESIGYVNGIHFQFSNNSKRYVFSVNDALWDELEVYCPQETATYLQSLAVTDAITRNAPRIQNTEYLAIYKNWRTYCDKQK